MRIASLAVRSDPRHRRPIEARHSTAERRAIRAASVADGIAAEMEAMVDALLLP